MPSPEATTSLSTFKFSSEYPDHSQFGQNTLPTLWSWKNFPNNSSQSHTSEEMAESSSTGGFSGSSFPNKGCFVRDPTKAVNLTEAPTYVLCTVPDVTNTTRIISVCGITDDPTQVEINPFDAPAGQTGEIRRTGMADPAADGWFFSDFYLFAALLRNAGASRKWITAEDPQALISKYGDYPHGNPCYERKVVLSREILDQGISNQLVITSKDSLKTAFLHHLRKDAAIARTNGQPLLVFLHGHGDRHSKGIALGDKLLLMEEVKREVGNDVKITILSTACFSAGWVINRNLNQTTPAAAGFDRYSESWPASQSIHRLCGSIYASALLKAWEEEATRAEEEEARTAPVQSQTLTYAAFTESVHTALFSIDRFADIHAIGFSAQDDQWSNAWGERTGIPLSDFKCIWDSLPTISPTQDATSLTNRDPTAGEDSGHHASSYGNLRDRLGSLKSRGLQGSLGSIGRAVKALIHVYLASHPGRDSLACNTSLHGRLRLIIEDKVKPTHAILEWACERVMYRLDLMQLADTLVAAGQLPKPKGLDCCSFDPEPFQRWMGSNPESLITRKYTTAAGFEYEKFLPQPTKAQGQPWHKPHHYLAAVLATDEKIDNKDAMVAAFLQLEEHHREIVTALKQDLDRKEDVRKHKSRWFQSLKKRVRSLSPDKSAQRKRRSTDASGSYLDMSSLSKLQSPGKGKRRQE
ncbi:hypothetical protein J1614_006940 [Plenodomus biglobosus]|nr:hypothetical protein J1614_006940 [Plenodomus biglobosus]